MLKSFYWCTHAACAQIKFETHFVSGMDYFITDFQKIYSQRIIVIIKYSIHSIHDSKISRITEIPWPISRMCLSILFKTHKSHVIRIPLKFFQFFKFENWCCSCNFFFPYHVCHENVRFLDHFRF